MAAVHLTKADFDQKIAKGVVFVDYFAKWCGPCKMAEPIIDQLAGEYKGKILIAKVNVDEQQELAQKYAVMSIPTVVIFKDGKEVDRIMGFIGKEGYEELIKKHIS